MVFFSCNACGESLKKNQVEKHYQFQCRRCESLSCIDCNKVFWGDEYAQHTKCISEEEKYSGKNFVPKANANKGEAKQNLWLKQVQSAIEQAKTNPKLKSMLERIQDYPNIPRKRPKFENFLKNSLNYRDNNLISQVWEVLMANSTQNQEKEKNDDKQNGIQSNGQKSEDGASDTPIGNGNITNEDVTEKKSKREKKEERRAKMNKKEKKDKNNVDEKSNEKKKEKKHKRKREISDEEEDVEPNCKKTANDLSKECQSLQQQQEEDEDAISDDENVKKLKTRFNWEEVITAVLKAKGEISLKKLRKKVLAEYSAQKGEPKSPTKVLAKLTKKVQNNKKFKVHKERVKLKDRK